MGHYVSRVGYFLSHNMVNFDLNSMEAIVDQNKSEKRANVDLFIITVTYILSPQDNCVTTEN